MMDDTAIRLAEIAYWGVKNPDGIVTTRQRMIAALEAYDKAKTNEAKLDQTVQQQPGIGWPSATLG